jgi:hypothetical protein
MFDLNSNFIVLKFLSKTAGIGSHRGSILIGSSVNFWGSGRDR